MEDETVDPSTLIICICSITSDDGFTIQCDNCLTWQHAVCIRIAPDDVPEEYLCDRCDPAAALERGVDKSRAYSIQKRREEEEDDDEEEMAAPQQPQHRVVVPPPQRTAANILRDTLGRKRRPVKPTPSRPRSKPSSAARPQLGTFSLSAPATTMASSSNIPATASFDVPPQPMQFPSNHVTSSFLATSNSAPPPRSSSNQTSFSSNSYNTGATSNLNNSFAAAPSEPLLPELGGGYDDSPYEVWEYEYTPVESCLWTDKTLVARLDALVTIISESTGGSSSNKSKSKSRLPSIASLQPTTPLTSTLTTSATPHSFISYLDDATPMRMDKVPAPLNLAVKVLPKDAFKVVPPSSSTFIPFATTSSQPVAPQHAYLSNMVASSSTSSNSGICPFPQPISHGLYANTNAAIPAGSFISALNGEITSLETYKSKAINQYNVMGVPKSGVRFISLSASSSVIAEKKVDVKGKGRAKDKGVTMVIDQRKWGDKIRFVRNGCHPNVIIRPILLPSSKPAPSHSKSKKGMEEDDETEQHWAGQRSGESHSCSTIVFGLFATRDIGRREEIILPWDWDNCHIVHSLPFLLDPTLSASSTSASTSTSANLIVPPNLSLADLQPLTQKMSDVTSTILGIMTCACAGSLSGRVVEGDCSLSYMCRVASVALATSSHPAGSDKRFRPTGSSKLGNATKREPFATLLLNALSATSSIYDSTPVNRKGSSASSAAARKTAAAAPSKKTVDLGPLVGLTRGWRDDFLIVDEATKLRDAAVEVEIERELARREEEDEQERIRFEKEEQKENKLVAQADATASKSTTKWAATPKSNKSLAAKRIQLSEEMAMDSDESDLTEPLSHFSSDVEGDFDSRRDSSMSKQSPLKIKNEKMDLDSSDRSSPAPEVIAPTVKVQSKKKVRDRAGEKVRRLERERLAAEEAKATRIQEKRKREAAERERDSKKRKKIIATTSSGSESDKGDGSDDDVPRPPKRKRASTLTASRPITLAPAARKSRSPSPITKPLPALMPTPQAPPLVAIPQPLRPPPPPPAPAPVVPIIIEPVREPSPPPPPPPPRVRLSMAAYRERQIANKLAETAAAALLPVAPSPTIVSTTPTMPPTSLSPALLPLPPLVSAFLSSGANISPPRHMSSSTSTVNISPIALPPIPRVEPPPIDFSNKETEEVLKSIGAYFAREALSNSNSNPVSVPPVAISPSVDTTSMNTSRYDYSLATSTRYISPEVAGSPVLRSPSYGSSLNSVSMRGGSIGGSIGQGERSESYSTMTGRSPSITLTNGLGLDTLLPESSTTTSSLQLSAFPRSPSINPISTTPDARIIPLPTAPRSPAPLVTLDRSGYPPSLGSAYQQQPSRVGPITHHTNKFVATSAGGMNMNMNMNMNNRRGNSPLYELPTGPRASGSPTTTATVVPPRVYPYSRPILGGNNLPVASVSTSSGFGFNSTVAGGNGRGGLPSGPRASISNGTNTTMANHNNINIATGGGKDRSAWPPTASPSTFVPAAPSNSNPAIRNRWGDVMGVNNAQTRYEGVPTGPASRGLHDVAPMNSSIPLPSGPNLHRGDDRRDRGGGGGRGIGRGGGGGGGRGDRWATRRGGGRGRG